MKKFFKYFCILCTCVFLYLMCDAFLSDDDTTTNQEVVDDDDYDDEYDDEDEYDDDEYAEDWDVDDAVESLKEEFDINDKDTKALIIAILEALKEDGSEIKTTDSKKTAENKTSDSKKTDTKTAKPAETQKPAKPAETAKPTEPKPAETKPVATQATGNRKVTAITGADYKNKLADYTASKTAAKKGVNAVVLVYLPSDKSCNMMLESLNSLANEFPKLDLYSMKLQECVELAKAYGMKELPMLIVLKDGKLEFHAGSLQTESLRAFLQKY